MMTMPISMVPFASIIVRVVHARSFDLQAHMLHILFLWKLAAFLPAPPPSVYL